MVKQGYKQTEIGVIPEDWEVVKIQSCLTEMTDFVAAGSFEALRNNVKVYDDENYALYVRLYDIRLGLGHIKQKYVDLESYKFLSKSNLFGEELLIANIGANVGEVFYMPKLGIPATIAPNMIVLRIKNNYSSKFLYYFIDSEYGKKLLNELISGSGHPKINKTDLKKLDVILPPLAEQEAIASALSDADAWIDRLEQLIAKKRLIKQGAMQTLLTPKEDWEVKKLGEMNFDISDGNYSAKYPKSSEFKETGVPFIRAVNIKNLKISSKDLRFISNELHNELLKGHLKLGDILITNRGDIGQLAFVDESFVGSNINAQIVRMNTVGRMDNRYLLYYLSTDDSQNKIQDLQTGSALKQLPINNLKNIILKFPNSLSEQERIATILSDMDAELEALEAQFGKARQIKQGMMQELLTGRIRLV